MVTLLWMHGAQMFARSGVTAALRGCRFPEGPSFEPPMPRKSLPQASDLSDGSSPYHTATCTVRVPRSPKKTAENVTALLPGWQQAPRPLSPTDSSEAHIRNNRLIFRPRIKDFFDAYQSGDVAWFAPWQHCTGLPQWYASRRKKDTLSCDCRHAESNPTL